MFLLSGRNTTFLQFLGGLAAGTVITLLWAFHINEDPPACAISLDKQHVLYIGMDNPLSILTSGMPSDQLSVTASGAGITLKKINDYQYTASVNTPQAATITVFNGKRQIEKVVFRVKRIPEPLLLLGAKHGGGKIWNGIFRVQEGLFLMMPWDYNEKCNVGSYDVVRQRPDQDIISVFNNGDRFTKEVYQMIREAQPGDTYIFENIRLKLPGDAQQRSFGPVSFQII